MYFVKARKNLEDQDAREIQDKGRRDRYQRSDSARLVVQAMPTAATHQPKQPNESKSQFHRSDSGAHGIGSEVDPSGFRPEELPDGACYRPKKDLTNLPSTSHTGAGISESQDIKNSNTGLMEHIRAVQLALRQSDRDLAWRQSWLQARRDPRHLVIIMFLYFRPDLPFCLLFLVWFTPRHLNTMIPSASRN
ncbi:hypothetical protein RRG08_016458 [Elysia crispata]|uniref:Uncharacterized protein n=1 Tax=Elysia crispata TaxID=231223 RepID=A0AAE1CUE7_9GAST|nr:hypothetical protein RRG08_016458 [Elysia crispata]